MTQQKTQRCMCVKKHTKSIWAIRGGSTFGDEFEGRIHLSQPSETLNVQEGEH
jgi:hypothetical protein